MQYKQSSDNKKITKELLLEYLQRVLKHLKALASVSSEIVEKAKSKMVLLIAEEILQTNDGLE
jgi:hypothetical protein